LVSELFEKGVDLGTIQHLYTGHGSSYVTELYAHADMKKKVVDLSKLAHIETAQKEPTKVESFLSLLNEDDRKEYDNIQLMDIPKKVKIELVALLKFKSKEELTIIRDWLNTRLEM
jgi:hypothetical protein